MKRILFLAVALAAATPAHAQSDLESGLLGALRGCEEWVLNPASWSEGTTPFIATAGLGNKMGRVRSVEDIGLPPPGLRLGNQYWRINATPDSGYVLVVSDRLLMCHVTGGGNTDLQPVVEGVLASGAFKVRWTRVQELPEADMASTLFRNVADPTFFIQISRANGPEQRLDRVQVIATATYRSTR